MEKPVVNSWTEFGSLEYVCVGSALGCFYPEKDPVYAFNKFNDAQVEKYIEFPVGPRPEHRILKAQAELANLVELLKGEVITVGTATEVDEDINKELKKMKSTLNPTNVSDDSRVVCKKSIETFRPPSDLQFDHLLMTPWFKNYYQFGVACPRDTVITLGNTILEAPTASRVRYFESVFYRPCIYSWWENDTRIHWKTAPQPTCSDGLYDQYREVRDDPSDVGILQTRLNESEVAFDAADLMRFGKDVFYKKGATANNKGIQWLRREFPNLRFHMMYFPEDESPHIDVNLVPLRPPTGGSSGIVMISKHSPPLLTEIKIFEDNDWKLMFCPLSETKESSLVSICSPALNMNLLSLSHSSCVIEECEVSLFHFLDDLGMDVITCPLRTLNEFGGGVHCVTWDVRRDDSCKDYFPNQNYDNECANYFTTVNDKAQLAVTN